MRKTVLFFLYLVQPIALHAKDMGSYGVVYPIDEQDPITLIQNKLRSMEESGDLERHRQELQNKTKAAIERPKSVERVTKAHKNRIFYYDPTYTVLEDLKDHTGRVFIAKGTKINPLETVGLSQGLLFFDGDDSDQVTFARKKLKESPLKLILVNGAPLALSEKLKVPVYFDQAGLLAKKLNIKHVPALVTQKDLLLRIEEIDVKTQTTNPSALERSP